MKKSLVLFFVALMSLSLIACGEETTSAESNQNQPIEETDNNDTSSDSVEDDNVLTIGDTAVGDTTIGSCFDLTLTRVEFAKEINSDTTNDNFMLPIVDGDSTSESIKASDYGDDDIFLSFSFEYKFTGKGDKKYHNHLTPSIVYDEEYYFNKDCVVVVYDDFTEKWDVIGQEESNPMASKLGISIPTTNYKVLDSTVYEARGIIRVPKELAENTDNSLTLSFIMNDGIFTIR